VIKKSRFVLTLALLLIICLTCISPALADPSESEAGTDIYARDPDEAFMTSEAAITKLLKAPYGTAIPASMSFMFKVTALGVNSEITDTAKFEAANAISGNATIQDETGIYRVVTIPIGKSPKAEGTDPNNITTWYLESDNIFDVSRYTHAGVYKYNIREIADPFDIDEAHESLVFSNAEYAVNVYVKTVGNVLEIAYIGVLRIKDDDGGDVSIEDQTKLDPTPGDPTIIGDYSDMAFTNKYVKTNGAADPKKPNPEDPAEATLYISNAVDGEYASPTMLFDFTLTITVPDLIEGYIGKVYKAYFVAANLDDDGNPTDGFYAVPDARPIEFTHNTAKTFQLMHGQRLVFVDTPVGTKYTVSEAEAEGYKPRATVSYGDDDQITIYGDQDVRLTLPNNDIDDSMLFVAESNSGAAFVNEETTSSPTGLNLNDLPFLGLIALALCALTAYITVIITRKRNCVKNCDIHDIGFE